MVQVEKYERERLGKLVMAVFALFEGGMLVWFFAILNGTYDPAAPVPELNIRNPMGFLAGGVLQAETRHNFMVGFLAVWGIGTVAMYLLSRATRTRILVTKER